MKNVKDLLAHLPYRASFYDKNLKLIYSNNRSDGSFFSEPEENELPQWVWTSLEQSPENALHFQIPTESFDHILFQTYQAVKDDSGELLGQQQELFHTQVPMFTVHPKPSSNNSR